MEKEKVVLNEDSLQELIREQWGREPEAVKIVKKRPDGSVVAALIDYDHDYNLLNDMDGLPAVFADWGRRASQIQYLGGGERGYADNDWKPDVNYDEFAENENLQKTIRDAIYYDDGYSSEYLEKLDEIVKTHENPLSAFDDMVQRLSASYRSDLVSRLPDIINEIVDTDWYARLWSREQEAIGQLILETASAIRAIPDVKELETLSDLIKHEALDNDVRERLKKLSEVVKEAILDTNESFYSGLYDDLLEDMGFELAVEIWNAKGYAAQSFHVLGNCVIGPVIVIGDDEWERLNGLKGKSLSEKQEALERDIELIKEWADGEIYSVTVIEAAPDGEVREIDGPVGAIIGEQGIRDFIDEVLNNTLDVNDIAEAVKNEWINDKDFTR